MYMYDVTVLSFITAIARCDILWILLAEMMIMATSIIIITGEKNNYLYLDSFDMLGCVQSS